MHGRSELKLHVAVRASARLFPATVDRMCTGEPPSPQGEGKGQSRFPRRSIYIDGTFQIGALHYSAGQSLPLEGKVSAEPTDEVFIQIQRLYIVPLFMLRL